MIFLFLILRKLYRNGKETGYFGPFVAFLGLALMNLTWVSFTFFEMGLIMALLFDKFYMDSHKRKLVES